MANKKIGGPALPRPLPIPKTRPTPLPKTRPTPPVNVSPIAKVPTPFQKVYGTNEITGEQNSPGIASLLNNSQEEEFD